MLEKIKIRSSESFRAMVLIALLATIFLAMPVLADDEESTLRIDRLKGTGVGMKVVFPETIKKDLNVVFSGTKINCEMVTSDTMYCIGSLRPKEIGTLNIYAGPDNTTVFATTAIGPASNSLDGK
jgi:hypothetical protein